MATDLSTLLFHIKPSFQQIFHNLRSFAQIKIILFIRARLLLSSIYGYLSSNLPKFGNKFSLMKLTKMATKMATACQFAIVDTKLAIYHQISCNFLRFLSSDYYHTGKCVRRFAGIYAYCRYFIDRKWKILVLILYRKTCHMPKGL